MVSVCSAFIAALSVTSFTEVRGDTNATAFVAHQATTRTFAADLQQTFHWTFPKKHIESVGRIYYQAPDMLAIILTNPAAESVIVRGSDLYVKRGKKPVVHRTLQVHNGRPTQNVQFLLSFFQNGCTNYIALFDAQMTQTNDTMTATLVPKHPMQMLPLCRVTNVLAWPTFEVRSMRIGLIWGSYITYHFSNVVSNETLDSSVFAIPKEGK